MAVRRIRTDDIVAGGAVLPSLIFSGRMPFYRIDNMEGIAVSERNGETRITIVSDNNYRPEFQRTLLLQFEAGMWRERFDEARRLVIGRHDDTSRVSGPRPRNRARGSSGQHCGER